MVLRLPGNDHGCQHDGDDLGVCGHGRWRDHLMNIQGVDQGSYQTLIASIIECHELIRRYASKKDRRQLLEFLPSAAVNSYLFGAQRAGRVVAVAIGGPTDKPRGLFNFKPDGTRLFVYYTLIHPDLQKNYREAKRLMLSMLR